METEKTYNIFSEISKNLNINTKTLFFVRCANLVYYLYFIIGL